MAVISAVKTNPDGSRMMKAEHLDKTKEPEDHTWNEYDLDRFLLKSKY
jgi:hypothetical protein